MNIQKFLNLFKKENNQEDSTLQGGSDDSMGIMPSQSELLAEEKVSRATKVKVVSALVLVGFATYAAWWIQEPVQYRADVLGSTQQTEEMAMDTSVEDTAADTETPDEPAMEENTDDMTAVEPPEAEITEEMVLPDNGMTQEISIIDFTYSPVETKIPVGGTVIWTNKDAVPHTVSGLDFTSGVMNPGDSFTYSFDSDGIYEYACSLHPQMKGTVVVGTGISAQDETPTEQIVDFIPPAEYLATEEVGPVTEPEDDYGMGGDQTPVTSADIAKAHASAAEQYADAGESKDITSSGPEDILYVGVFAVILYLRRKKILSRQS